MLFYLDAGSGSMIAQAVVAGVAGASVVAKTQWRRISGAFKKKDGAAPEATTPTEAPRESAENVPQ